jgi:hypothetical protein
VTFQVTEWLSPGARESKSAGVVASAVQPSGTSRPTVPAPVSVASSLVSVVVTSPAAPGSSFSSPASTARVAQAGRSPASPRSSTVKSSMLMSPFAPLSSAVRRPTQ